jgi:type IV pilus assembly protein PilC
MSPMFSYQAKDRAGQTREGTVDAVSRAAALLAVDGMGLMPVRVEELRARAEPAPRLRRGRVHARDITVFTRQLGSLTRSGVPILRALATIRRQAGNLTFRDMLTDVEARVRDGTMLSEALSRYPRFFPELYINMVRSGESAGLLDTMLFRLSEAREKEEDVSRKVRAATAYPLLIVAVGLVTVFVLLAFFLPKVVSLFDTYTQLPLLTRILIGASAFVSTNGHWIVMILVLLFAIIRRLASFEQGRLFFDRIKLRLPLLGRCMQESDVARFARTLALLIDAGIPLDRALPLSAATLRNQVMRDEIHGVQKRTVEEGMPLSSGLERLPHFPPIVANLAAVGEEGGRLDEALNEVADYFDKEVEHRSRLATSLLEPILILVIGLVVGFIIMAMLLPIFEISTSF